MLRTRVWEESMRIGLGLAGLLACSALGLAACGDSGVSTAEAADAAGSSTTVTAIGCPKTPKPECVTVTADGKTWDVTAAGVDVNRGVAVSVSGMPGPAGACGPTLDQPQVEYTGLQCARGAR